MATVEEAIAFALRQIDIFPMELGSKRPSISFIEQATRDPERIRQLWRDPITGSKDYNIGVLCGGTLIIVDIDTKYDKKFKRSAIANYESIGGHWDTLVVKTASGGYQAYFRLPIGKTFTNMQDLVPAVDIRCEHGYGIGPGSFSIESGGGYEIFIDKPIAELPEIFIPLLKPIKTRKERFNGHADSEKAIPLYVAYLQHVEPAIEGQGGDQHTYNVACMGVRDYGLSEPTTTALMLEFFNPRCEPPWNNDELQHKVENAESYAIGQTGSRDPENVLNGLSYVHVPTAPAVQPMDDDSEFNVVNDIPRINWLVKPMLVQKELTIFVGPGGIGKSLLLIAFGCHATVGKAFGPYEIREAFDVFIYNPEDSRDIMSGRIACTCRAYGLDEDHVKQHFQILGKGGRIFTLVEYVNRKMQIPDETVRFFSGYKQRHPNLKLIVADPLRKMLRGINENDNAQMSEAMIHLDVFANELDVGLIVSHHVVKNLMLRKDLDPDNPDLSVGAGSVISSARTIVNILPQTPYEIDMQGKRDYYLSSRIVKNNHGEKGFLTWWERKIMRHVNGEQYPIAIPTNVKDATLLMYRSYINTIGDHMTQNSRNTLSVAQAAIVVKAECAPERTDRATNELIRNIFKRGETTHSYTDIVSGQSYTMVLGGENRKQMITLVETTQGRIQAPSLILPTYQEPEEGPAPLLA